MLFMPTIFSPFYLIGWWINLEANSCQNVFDPNDGQLDGFKRKCSKPKIEKKCYQYFQTLKK